MKIKYQEKLDNKKIKRKIWYLLWIPRRSKTIINDISTQQMHIVNYLVLMCPVFQSEIPQNYPQNTFSSRSLRTQKKTQTISWWTERIMPCHLFSFPPLYFVHLACSIDPFGSQPRMVWASVNKVLCLQSWRTKTGLAISPAARALRYKNNLHAVTPFNMAEKPFLSSMNWKNWCLPKKDSCVLPDQGKKIS